MRFNEPITREQSRLIAAALGDSAVPAADQVAALIAGLGLPCTLGDVGGLTDVQLEAVAQAAMADPWIKTNPRPIVGASEVRDLLNAAR